MAKIALLIGVSDYGPGFDSIPRAPKDVRAMQQPLQHPEIASFAEVRTLINPNRQVMQEAIETLFSERQRDLVLLYFSGHSIKDDSGKLYLATSITRKNARKKLIKSSAVPVSFVHEAMHDSCSKHQVVILDCCFDGALAEGWSDNGSQQSLQQQDCDIENTSMDISNQLNEGKRAILAASTSTWHFVEQQSDSAYTRYLVEGMETGAADLDNDGVMSIQELHNYASRKVQIATPAVKPGIYGLEADWQQILLAKASLEDPQRRYRQEIERCVNRGKISIASRGILDVLQNTLGLQPGEAAAIEAEVLEPYLEYQKKLQRYTQRFIEAIQRESLRDETRNKLKSFQQTLGLTDADVAPVEAQARQREPLLVSSQADLVDQKPTTLHETVKPVKQLNKAVVPITETSTRLWNKSAHPASMPTPGNFRLLITIGIATVLAWVGVIYKFSSRPTPSTSLLKPRPISVPEPPSSSTPTPLTTSVPVPSRLLPDLPTTASDPSSMPKPPVSVPEPPSMLVPSPPPSKPQASASKPMPAASVVKPPLAKPKASVPNLKSTAAVSRSRPIVAPDAPPISWSEPPPTSAPRTTSSAPEPPPKSWSEPPPTSAPGSNF